NAYGRRGRRPHRILRGPGRRLADGVLCWRDRASRAGPHHDHPAARVEFISTGEIGVPRHGTATRGHLHIVPPLAHTADHSAVDLLLLHSGHDPPAAQLAAQPHGCKGLHQATGVSDPDCLQSRCGTRVRCPRMAHATPAQSPAPVCVLCGARRSGARGLVGAAAAMMGTCLIGAQFVLYGLSPAYYQTITRGTGTGAAVALSRLGSATGPYLAGQLLGAGASATQVLQSLLPLTGAAAIAALLLMF